jgi:hypothetical protein
MPWALWRGVYFTSSRTGYAARQFDQIWQNRYGAPGAAPPRMQMPLAEGMQLLGVPPGYTREDINAAFRRMAKLAHPDAGGSGELFRRTVQARDRLLDSLGIQETAPATPQFAPKGLRVHYRRVRSVGPRRLGHTRRLAG